MRNENKNIYENQIYVTTTKKSYRDIGVLRINNYHLPGGRNPL